MCIIGVFHKYNSQIQIIMNSGSRANKTGGKLENTIESTLTNYTKIDRTQFLTTYMKADAPIYSRQVHIGDSIYNTKLFCDFILYHPKKHPHCLVIESKWQQTAGSVDEKYPYLVENINKLPYKTLIVIDGGGYKKGAEEWLRKQQNDKLQVMNIVEFLKWTNNDNI